MNRRSLTRVTTLVAMLGLAVASLLLLFLLLDQSKVGATPERAGPIPDVRAQNGTFTVSGTVTCEATGPISDVEVFVWDRDKGTGGFSKFTDSNGYYSVTMTGGHYDFNFHPPCGSECASKACKGITGPPDLTLSVVLTRGYTISGTVFATNSTTPVGNVSIYVFNHDTADGFGLPLTDADGHYCVSLAEGYDDLSFTPPVCLGLGSQAGITVTRSMTRNVTLPPGFAVGGCVTEGIGDPVPGVQIYAYDPTPGIGGFGFAPTNEMGCYTGTLPLGTFDIQFIPAAGRGLGSITVVDVVSETGGCPNTWRPITLPAGFTVSGQVTCQGQPVKNVYVYAAPVEGGAPGDDLVGWGLYTVDDGSYGLPLVSGTYFLEFIPPPATGLNAKAFTTMELITDTVVNVDFCVCSGVWISETVDSAGDMGHGDTSLVLAPIYPYTPHISYHDGTNDSLKYAWLSGTTWLSETVDSGGQWISLALVPTHHDIPCISYHDYQGAALRYACRDDITWITKTVPGSWAGKGGVSLALEPTDPCTPHISYCHPVAKTLYYAYLSGTTWISGTWVIEVVESPGSEAGARNSLALESTYPYTPHISYHAGATTTLDLKHAWKSGTTWLSETVDSGGDVGGYTSLALDSSSNAHISYYDGTNGNLKYAWLRGTTWLSETVDSAGDVGSFTSLEMDWADTPYISYYDATNDDLKFAHFNDTVWIIQTVDSEGDVGQYSSLALDQVGCPHISYYDATQGDLKYAYLLPPVCKIYLPIILKSY